MIKNQRKWPEGNFCCPLLKTGHTVFSNIAQKYECYVVIATRHCTTTDMRQGRKTLPESKLAGFIGQNTEEKSKLFRRVFRH
jgi:hypothetical protein